MNKLKVTLIMTSAFIFIDYSEEADEIIVDTDKNESKWENTLNQVERKIKKNILFIIKTDFDQTLKKNMMLWSKNIILFWKCWRNVDIIYEKFTLFWS